MSRSFLLMVVLLSSVGVVSTVAQTFPIRVTPILTPPYTPFLTDYTDAGAERLTVQVILNDLTVSEFRTKLRLTIEGVGITITTNPNYIPLPITLQGGIPQLIYGSDMADYFKLSNLVFQGLNPSEVEKNGGRLPEGIYRISIEVLDYNRNTVVSNKGSATAWMILNDPPFINLPINNAKIKPLNPQNVVLQWTPRHRGSPNAAFTTEYEVRLVEIWPAGRNPFDAINTSRPIFETTTASTMVVYGPAETPLVLGREYALQVRAKDTGGRDVFKNSGYSEVVRFIYGDECPMPTSLEADDISTAKARMRWQGNGQNSAYLIKLREQKEGARWFSERTEQSYYNSTNLRAGTTYEYQLTGECDIYQSKESEIETFSTLAENPNAFICADPNTIPPPDGSPPLRALFTNDFIHAGGFDVVVNQATGSNGKFTGEGLAIVPWFNSAKVRVTFKDISVNSSYQLTAGNIESVWDANSRFIVESEKTLAEGGGKGLESKVGVFEADTLITMPGIILSVSVHPDTGDITVETRDGAVTVPREEGKTVAITDEAGNGYLVDKVGKVTKTTASDAQLAGARGEREYSTDENLKVDFLKATDTKYGLDLPQTVLAQNYQQTENGEYVAWKALKAGEEDHVAVAARGTGDITKANFKTGLDAQALTPNAETAGTVRLNVMGKTDGQIDELLAFYPNPDTSKAELVAGKLNMISYDIEKKSLVLVSVNGTEASDIGNLQQRLNEIYNQGVVEWASVQQQDITVSGIDAANIDDGGSGLLSNYTEDMKKILRAYTGNNTLAENTYYLFLVKNSTSKNKLGYMPRKRQAGFIFVDAHNGQDVVLTMAHELGHGAFHLKHTFSEYSLSQGVTENLMDYPAKTRLDKWQWDKIHNPEAVLGLFEDDDEGALRREFYAINRSNDIVISNNKFVVFDGQTMKLDIFNYSSITSEVRFKLTIEPDDDENKISIPGKDWEVTQDQRWSVDIERPQEGLYIIESKVGESTKILKFWIRHRQYDFACSVCGKDLEMDADKMKVIFPGARDDLTNKYVDAFNVVLQDSSFPYNTCDRQAKIFAQIAIETNYLRATTEGKNKVWELHGEKQLLDYFKATVMAKIRWFNQDFWDEKKYKDFIQIGYYEKISDSEVVPEDQRFLPKETKDYYGIYRGEIQTKYLVKVPDNFSKDKKGEYKQYDQPSVTEQIQIEKNIFNYAYGGNTGLGNGDHLTTDDGFNYRGRGGVQTTGKANYEMLKSDLKKAPYNYSVDVVSNPELVASDPKVVVYSAFIDLKRKLINDITKLDVNNINSVSSLVNTGSFGNVANDANSRMLIYTRLKRSLLKCENKENEK